jgi:hypothetical protein
MAGLAILCAGCLVVKDCILPVCRAMTLRALSREVIGGFVSQVAGKTVLCAGDGMVKGQAAPGRGVVAGAAAFRKVIGRLVKCVTAFTLRWRTCILSVRMARAAFQRRMLPGEREKGVFGSCTSWKKSHRSGIYSRNFVAVALLQ